MAATNDIQILTTPSEHPLFNQTKMAVVFGSHLENASPAMKSVSPAAKEVSSSVSEVDFCVEVLVELLECTVSFANY